MRQACGQSLTQNSAFCFEAFDPLCPGFVPDLSLSPDLSESPFLSSSFLSDCSNFSFLSNCGVPAPYPDRVARTKRNDSTPPQTASIFRSPEKLSGSSPLIRKQRQRERRCRGALVHKLNHLKLYISREKYKIRHLLKKIL